MLTANLVLVVSSLAIFSIVIYISQVVQSEFRPTNYKRSLLNQQIAKRS